jgi:hypothetical protein
MGRPAVSVWKRIRGFYLAHFSKPVHQRELLKTLAKQRFHRLVEIGVGDAQRSLRLIEMASLYWPADQITYAGIDLFEARGATGGMSLKQAHCLLKPTGAQIRLIPGDPLSALSRTANSLGGSQLVVISADQDATSLGAAWFFVPRILGPGATVFAEMPATGEEPTRYRRIEATEIQQLASRRHRRAA